MEINLWFKYITSLVVPNSHLIQNGSSIRYKLGAAAVFENHSLSGLRLLDKASIFTVEACIVIHLTA
jgi:hypothetical protein